LRVFKKRKFPKLKLKTQVSFVNEAPVPQLWNLLNTGLVLFQVQAEIDELEMVVLEQQDKLTLREKFSYMSSRAVQMPLGITLVLFGFQVNMPQ
jgi:hypothetical protein